MVFSGGLGFARPDDGFLGYWARFRAAALRGDMAALAGLTRFPLQAGFDSEQDRPKPIARSQVAAYFRTELGCQGAGQGTNLDDTRRNAQLQPPYDFHNARRAIVGSFVFEKVAGQWRFTAINYGDPSEHEAVLKGHCA